MKSINFNEGAHEYKINNDESRVIRLRLEPEMVGRFEKAAKDLAEMIKTAPDDPTLEEFEEFGKKACQLIDKSFNADVSGPAFGGANPLVPGADGKMLFEAFFEAFMPVVEEDIRKLKQVGNKPHALELRPEVQKYVVKPYMANPYVKEESAMPDVNALSKEQKAQLIAQLLS